MKNKIRPANAIVFLICVLAGCSQTFGQRPVAIPLNGGGSVAIYLRSEPTEAQNPFISAVYAEHDHVIHRLIVNESAGYYFGYDLIITPLPESRQFKVMARPFEPEYDQWIRSLGIIKRSNAGQPDQKGINVALSKPSTPQNVDDGAYFAIDLLVNATTGAKVFDAIKISYDDLRLTYSGRNSPRDFTLDDVELSVRNYQLHINGNLASSRLSSGFSGPILWFYLPGKGRFIFSVKPHKGYDFQKIGAAEYNNLIFTIDGDDYLWSSTSPIIERGGNWNIWILHEPDYKPEQDSVALSKLKTAPSSSTGDKSFNPLTWGMAKNIEDLYPKQKH